ncbi:MAG: hypothetical protein EHM48_09565, partial [Planctomycetaceae bacterium]
MAKKTAVRHVQTSVCELLEPRLFLSTTLFREGGGAGYVNATFDDAEIASATDTTKGTDTLSITAGGTKYGLLGVNDLFSLLPKTANGQLLNVSQAKLHLFRYNTGTSSNTISVFRATTDWMTDVAGASESDVTFQHSDKSADVHWASGNFSSSDYDSANGATTNFVSNYNQEVVIDITSLVQTMYQNEVNDGFVIYANSTINFRPSENGSSSLRPSLEITYEYVASGYSLTVNSGTGDGTYDEDEEVNIAADAPATGMHFDVWTGDTSGVANVYASSTTFTMPAEDAEITATYDWTDYSLSVASGTGDGSTYHY